MYLHPVYPVVPGTPEAGIGNVDRLDRDDLRKAFHFHLRKISDRE